MENDELKGSDIEMIKLLSKKIGFSYNLQQETYLNVFWMVRQKFHNAKTTKCYVQL